MRYVVNNNVFKTPQDVKIYILKCSGDKYFKEMLNEKYGQIEICEKNIWHLIYCVNLVH